MIVKEKVGNVEMSSDIVVNQFKIKASRKAFEILSSGLYSDKTKAIVRELSTNAYDSHVQAGKKKEPFFIHLPSSLEPWFAVRDNGIGMSPEQVNSIYSTYFESNKTGSNDMVGCLGLGSKSPFSYTDQFNVESRFGGVKTLYNCFVDASGVPTIAKLGETPTDECNGVEIKFPVKRDDFWEFEEKSKDVLSWFKTLPVVNGNPNFSFDKKEYVLETEKYSLRKEKGSYYNPSSHIIMGNVAYEININDLQGASQEQFTTAERTVLNWGVDINLNIGQIDITANREKVNYDQSTFNAVRDVLVVAVEDMKKEIEGKIASTTTSWEARCALHQIRHSILGQVKDMVTCQWNGVEITDHIGIHQLWMELGQAKEDELVAIPGKIQQMIDAKEIEANVLDNISKPHWKGCSAQRAFFKAIVGNIELYQLQSTRNDKYRRNVTSNLYADGKTIIYDDLNHGGYARVSNYCRENKLQDVYMLQGMNEATLKSVGLDTVVIRSSTLPKPIRNKRTSGVVRQRTAKSTLNEYTGAFSGKNGKDAVSAWKEAEVDAEDGGVYVEMLYYKVKTTKEQFIYPDILTSIKGYLKTLDADADVPIYGIRPNDVEKIKKHSEEWISLEEHVKTVIEENKHLEKELKLANMYENHYDTHANGFWDHKFSANSVFGKYVVACKEAYDASMNSKAKAYRNLCNYVSVPSEEYQSKDNTLSDLKDAAWKKYPMLAHISFYDKSSTKDCINYINAIDSLEVYKNLEKLSLDKLAKEVA